MAFDCVGRGVMRFEPGRNVIVAEPPRSNQSSSVAHQPLWPNMLRYQTPLRDGTCSSPFHDASSWRARDRSRRKRP